MVLWPQPPPVQLLRQLLPAQDPLTAQHHTAADASEQGCEQAKLQQRQLMTLPKIICFDYQNIMHAARVHLQMASLYTWGKKT